MRTANTEDRATPAGALARRYQATVLRVRDLDVRLAGREVLQDVTMDVVSGELMGLLTRMARAKRRFCVPSSGSSLSSVARWKSRLVTARKWLAAALPHSHRLCSAAPRVRMGLPNQRVSMCAQRAGWKTRALPARHRGRSPRGCRSVGARASIRSSRSTHWATLGRATPARARGSRTSLEPIAIAAGRAIQRHGFPQYRAAV